jgi:excisionase family DNA binding protein
MLAQLSQQEEVMPRKEKPITEEMLTVEEVAEALRITSRAVQRYCDQGLFPGAFKTSGLTSKWRIPRSGFESYLKAQRDQATKA